MKQKDIHECCGCKENTCKKCIWKSEITVQTCDKDVYRIHLHEIIYIAIEGRKSVMYLTDRKIETNYRLEYWKDILDPELFAQPQYSFIVNLNYVDSVVKDVVNMSCRDEKYSVYTSTRKIGAFKKAFLNFGKR